MTLKINNWINGEEAAPRNDSWIKKINPHDRSLIGYVADSSIEDVNISVQAAKNVFHSWSNRTAVERGQILLNTVIEMKKNERSLADCIAVETGKPPQDALGEVKAAIMQAEYFSGEGLRLFGKSLTSGMPGKSSFTVRQARGIAALIVPANTPIANIAWKIFPALICGNTAVLKASEDAPSISILMAKLLKESGLPDGVFNVIQGNGHISGAALVEHPDISIISFTGSTNVGRKIAEIAGIHLKRLSLELGGKNPFVVCEDCDLDEAVKWASLSAFSNAGQRCAAASRILVFKSIYEEFKSELIKKANSLKLGVTEGCDLGPVINGKQFNNIKTAISTAKSEGGTVICGGGVPTDKDLSKGFYISPTLIEGLSTKATLNCNEAFGPLATLQKVNNIQEALDISNNSEYGLTSAIHTKNIDKAMWYAKNVKAGVANINIGTFGSEPHMPFGGFGASGNGTREPGVEALDVYSELKNISILTREI